MMNAKSITNSPAPGATNRDLQKTGARPFVPPPLPPDLSVDLELMRLLSDADRALGELAGLGRTLANPALLIGPFMRREAVLSSRIEGTRSDLADLYAYEAGQLELPDPGAQPGETDVREVMNYVVALQYGIERLEKLPVSLRLIRELHEKLMKGVRGEYAAPGDFRQVQNWIGPPDCQIEEATFIPPAVPEMRAGLDALERYIQTGDPHPPLIRLAMIHYQFEAIHPFNDGNGRVGRLLIILLLITWDLLPYPLLYLSAFFEKHRNRYLDLLLGVSRDGAWREWIAFFLQGVAEASHDGIDKAKRMIDLQSEMRTLVQRNRRSGLVNGIVDILFEKPIITANYVAQEFGVSHQGAINALRQLTKPEIAILTDYRTDSGNVIFMARKILEIAR